MWKPFRFNDLPGWLQKEWNPHNFYIKRKLVKVYHGEPFSYKVLFTQDRRGNLHIRCWRRYNRTTFHKRASKINQNKVLIGAFIGLFCIFFVIVFANFNCALLPPQLTQTPTTIPTTIISTTSTVPTATTRPSTIDLTKNPSTRSFPYLLRANHGLIQYTLYEGVYDKISNSKVICYSHENPSYCFLKYLKNPIQDTYLKDLVNRIKSESSNPDDQARIAVSMIQHIPYDFDRPVQIKNNLPYKIRHPYEVLYENEGDCGEHSFLLAYILKELGYGVVLFYFKNEPHMVVGLKCPQEYSYRNTGFAFVETVQPSIITYSYKDYENPEIIVVSDGKLFNSIEEEFKDAQQFENILSMGQITDVNTYNKWQYLVQKYGLKTS